MDNNYQNFKKEVEKVNLRIKEYLWKKWNSFKTTIFKFPNAWSQFLAR